MKKLLAFIYVLIFTNVLISQPSSTPASGYSWVLTGTSTYNSTAVSTVPSVPDDTSYGQSGDSDPSSCASSCGGSCDGSPLIRKKVFGPTPGYSNTSCEQRAINLNHWNNLYPNSGVPNGASSGTVYLPTSSTVNIIQSPSNGTPGTGAGGDENYGWIIGGWGSPNTSKFNVTVDWNLGWSSAALGGFSGSQTRQNTGSFIATDPGGSTEQQISGGWINGGLGFGESFSDVFSIPISYLPQNGGTFEVKFVADATISISREWGNADGMAQHGPGMEGRASHTVEYQIWQIQPTLPVKLSNFQGKSIKNEIELSWVAQSEINLKEYEIEKSKNNLDWNTIGTVLPNSISKYSFVDSKPFVGDNYYRLKQVDQDGNFNYSNIITISQNSNSINIYPNPVFSILEIKGTEVKENSQIRITDVFGRTVLMQDFSKNIDVSNLIAGNYWLKIIDANNNEIDNIRFVKQ